MIFIAVRLRKLPDEFATTGWRYSDALLRTQWSEGFPGQDELAQVVRQPPAGLLGVGFRDYIWNFINSNESI